MTRAPEVFQTCPADASSDDGNPGIIGAQMCKWPFAQKAIISSTPELNHAGCCGPESEGRHWQDHLLVRNQEVRFHPHVPRESRPADQQCSSTDAGCRTSKLSPPCAACALSGDSNSGTIGAQMCKWPFAHIAIISSTPELNHAACCDREPERRHWKDLLLVRHQEVRIRPRSRGSRVHRLSSPLQPMPGGRRRNFPNLRSVRFIRRRQPGYHWCTDV